MNEFEEELVNLYRYVYYYVNSRVNDIDVARDITQEVMERAIEKYQTLRKKESLKAWITQIAKNQVCTYYNDLKKRCAHLTYTEEKGEEIKENAFSARHIKEDILTLIVSNEDKVNLIRALNMLERKYQDVIRLKYICGYNCIEIAEILNVNVNTVRTWSARGLVRLKEEFVKLDSGESHGSIKR